MNDSHLLQCMLENYKELFIAHCHNDDPEYKQYIVKTDIEPAIEWAKRRAEAEEEVRKQWEEDVWLNDADNDDL